MDHSLSLCNGFTLWCLQSVEDIRKVVAIARVPFQRVLDEDDFLMD